MKQPPMHSFTFNLPVNPHNDSIVLEMDGQPLRGVTDVCVKAGTNGYTNVILGFEARAAIEMTGALVANVNLLEIGESAIASIYDSSLAQLGEDPIDPEMKMRLVELILQKLISNYLPPTNKEATNAAEQPEKFPEEPEQ